MKNKTQQEINEKVYKDFEEEYNKEQDSNIEINSLTCFVIFILMFLSGLFLITLIIPDDIVDVVAFLYGMIFAIIVIR